MGGVHAHKRPRTTSAAEEESKVTRAQQDINTAMEAIMRSLSPAETVGLRAVILQPSDPKRIHAFLGKCLSDKCAVTVNMVASTTPAAITQKNRALGRMVISANNGKAYLQLNTNVILCGAAVEQAIKEHPEGGSWVLLDQNLYVKSIKTMSSVMSERMPAVIEVQDSTSTSMVMNCNDENNTVVEFKFCTSKPHADDTRKPYWLKYDYIMHLSNDKLRSMLKDMGSSGNVGIEIYTQHATDVSGRSVTMRHMNIIGGDDDSILSRKAQFICKRRNVVDTETGDVKVTRFWEFCEESSVGDLFARAPMMLRARVTAKLFYLQLLCQNVPPDRSIILCLGMTPDQAGQMPVMVKVPYSADAAAASLVKLLILTNENTEDDFKYFDESTPVVPEGVTSEGGESKDGSEDESALQCYQIEDIDDPDTMADFTEYCSNPATGALDTAAQAFGPDDEEDLPPTPTPTPPSAPMPASAGVPAGSSAV